MKITRTAGFAFVLALVLVDGGMVNTSRASPPANNVQQTLPPVIISDGSFAPFPFWVTTEETSGGASATVEQRTSGGNPDEFRFMSHRLPPVSGSDLAVVSVTHTYHERYDPRINGEIRAIDYTEDGIILSFPFADAFSTTQAVVEQGGRIFRSVPFIRFVAQNSSHAWETKTLSQLTAADFVAVDDSGDHPDFTARGSPMRFGYIRINSRSSSQPPVPANEELVIEQGVDNWKVTIYRDNTARPPQAVDDVIILDGSSRSLPFLEFIDVVRNDRDPNFDTLELITVTEPAFGSAGVLSRSSVAYSLDEPRAEDFFGYTVSDGVLSDTGEVAVYIDCACTVLCLNNLKLPEAASTQATDALDIPLIYRVRDQVLKQTLDGRRYVEMYYRKNPEILVNTMTNEPLRTSAVAGVELWQDNLHSLVDGDGSAVITQAQVDALRNYLNDLAAVSSDELQQLIDAELERLGPLDDYVGLSMVEAKRKAIGDATLSLPFVGSGQ